jgi:hypothetical protein
MVAQADAAVHLLSAQQQAADNGGFSRAAIVDHSV